MTGRKTAAHDRTKGANMKRALLLSVCVCWASAGNLTKTVEEEEGDVLDGVVFVDDEQPSVPCGEPSELYPPALDISDGELVGLAKGIVGGDEAVEHSLPWQVMLMLPTDPSGKRGKVCGGTIIDKEWIVTAAHCYKDKEGGGRLIHRNDKLDPLTTKIYVGQHLKYKGKKVWPAEVIVHEKYGTAKRIGFDIALIKLKEPLIFSDKVRPICLPNAADDFHKDEGKVLISGWGYTEEDGETSKPLKQAVTQLSWTQCKEVYGAKVNDNEICAYHEGLDTCQGDSGGPLAAYRDGHFVLAGVTSWGRGCARKGVPGVYTDVASLRDWISQHAGV